MAVHPNSKADVYGSILPSNSDCARFQTTSGAFQLPGCSTANVKMCRPVGPGQLCTDKIKNILPPTAQKLHVMFAK
jgi:hypothetical protein